MVGDEAGLFMWINVSLRQVRAYSVSTSLLWHYWSTHEGHQIATRQLSFNWICELPEFGFGCFQFRSICLHQFHCPVPDGHASITCVRGKRIDIAISVFYLNLFIYCKYKTQSNPHTPNVLCIVDSVAEGDLFT
ncbi:hypothetical protein KC19_VG205300 [Ceratodon purpureus]|uniref:Uncharacterized protein n=1 Tax=Ceratodon purpureus TaxID=3225 RepID=A0A8T0HSK9_CERPU|nr:hypothetical protein KC19_VG205300 [Ceratodon purpureus]